MSVLYVAIAAAPSPALAAVLVLFFGVAYMQFASNATAMISLHSSPEMRGRMISVCTIVFVGSAPVGGPILGVLADHVQPRAAMLAASASAGAGALIVFVALGREVFTVEPAASKA